MAPVMEKKKCPGSKARGKTPAAAGSSDTERRNNPDPSVFQGNPWTLESIRHLLDVWASPDIQGMREAGKKYRVIYKGIANRLQKDGVQRNWMQCRDMMYSLEDLYCSVREGNQNRTSEPILCPFKEALEKVLPWRENSQPESYEPSGMYNWNPMPTFPRFGEEQRVPWVTDSDGNSVGYENGERGWISPQEVPQLIPWNPSPFTYIPNQVTDRNVPQGPFQDIPRTPSPIILIPNHVPQENILQHSPQVMIPWTSNHFNISNMPEQGIPQGPPQIISLHTVPLSYFPSDMTQGHILQSPFYEPPWTPGQLTQERCATNVPQFTPNQSPPTVSIQCQGTHNNNSLSVANTSNDAQAEPQEIPSTVSPLTMDNEKAAKDIPQDPPHQESPSSVTPLSNMDKEPLENTPQDPIVEAVPEVGLTPDSVQNEEIADDIPQDPPQALSSSPTSYIQNEERAECYPPVICTSPLFYSHGVPPFFPPPQNFFPNFYVQTR